MVGTILPRLWSDHCPIVLKHETMDYGPIPFKLFNSWSFLEGYDQVVREAWNDTTQQEGENMFINFKNKLKNVKVKLKAWHKNMSTNNRGTKHEYIRRLEQLDAHMELYNATHQMVEERLDIMKHLADLEKKEGMDLAQKLKLKWGLEGDENSKFFHAMLKKKRRKATINGVLEDGS
ncbi:cytochrome P450 [Artemisia annua]|uniref:Cytochrome P450 n=1 Tax=Artemisia annua TaxID=35608 RepID=A0A2U1QGN3_ARTAN|nr:cytochrome P450 [Artemisia annua]